MCVCVWRSEEEGGKGGWVGGWVRGPERLMYWHIMPGSDPAAVSKMFEAQKSIGSEKKEEEKKKGKKPTVPQQPPPHFLSPSFHFLPFRPAARQRNK